MHPVNAELVEQYGAVFSSTSSTILLLIPFDTMRGVAVSPINGNVYVANYGSTTVAVSVISPATNTVTATTPYVTGSNPFGVAVSPTNGNVYVTNLGSNTVSVVDPITNQVTGSPITVGTTPIRVTVSPNGANAYVINYTSNTVSVINTTNNQVVGSPIPVGTQPSGMAVTPTAPTSMSPTPPATRCR